MDNFLFTKEEADKLFDDNISVWENKDLLKKADSRLEYVIETMATIIGRKFDWYDFDNENSSDNGNPIRGYFSPEDYRTEVYFIGKDFATKNEDFHKYDRSFPTKWLWTNFEDELQKEVADFEAKNEAIKQEQLDAKDNLQKIAQSMKSVQAKIFANIPPEMRNNFSFKSPEQVHKERLNKANDEYQAAQKLLKEQEDYLRNTLSPEEFEIIQLKKPEDLLQRANSKAKKPKR
jgi:hypothetical protein